MTHTAYIALGSNIGDRGQTLLSAVQMLDKVPGVKVQRISQFLATEPVGGPPDQPDYLNAAAEIHTTLEPRQLLERLHEIERTLGRRRETETRWGSRTCDLDILLVEDLVIDDDDLTIPHPRMHERAFVLEPLASIAPDALHPRLNKTIAQLLADLQRPGRRGGEGGGNGRTSGQSR